MYKSDKTFSIITIVNNQNQYKQFKDCLDMQKNCEYELIKINNINGEFSGARQAFNSAANQATGKYLLFVHPDIRFLNENVLFNMEKELRKLDDFGVVGIAGVKKQLEHKIYSNIIHGEDQRRVGEGILEPVTVQTVDECLFIIRKDNWKNHNFSLRKGWHLYAVEQCLNFSKQDYKNYVIPTDGIWHISDGKSEDAGYYVILKKLLSEYEDIGLICTTVRNWGSNGLKNKLLVNLYLIHRKLFKRR